MHLSKLDMDSKSQTRYLTQQKGTSQQKKSIQILLKLQNKNQVEKVYYRVSDRGLDGDFIFELNRENQLHIKLDRSEQFFETETELEDMQWKKIWTLLDLILSENQVELRKFGSPGEALISIKVEKLQSTYSLEYWYHDEQVSEHLTELFKEITKLSINISEGVIEYI